MWTVDAHANVKGNWVHFMDGDADPFFTEFSVSNFLVGTQEFCLPKLRWSHCFWASLLIRKPMYEHILYEHSLQQIQYV